MSDSVNWEETLAVRLTLGEDGRVEGSEAVFVSQMEMDADPSFLPRAVQYAEVLLGRSGADRWSAVEDYYRARGVAVVPADELQELIRNAGFVWAGHYLAVEPLPGEVGMLRGTRYAGREFVAGALNLPLPDR